MPRQEDSELQLLTEKDWFDAIKNAKQLETDADYREALHHLRNSAKQGFGEMATDSDQKICRWMRTVVHCLGIYRN